MNQYETQEILEKYNRDQTWKNLTKGPSEKRIEEWAQNNYGATHSTLCIKSAPEQNNAVSGGPKMQPRNRNR